MKNTNIENVIIIGSGPAGHSAAIYASRANLNPLMYEGLMAGGVAAGGQLTTTTEVENYAGFPEGISGPDLMSRMREQSVKYGTKIKTATIDKVDLSHYPFKIYSEEEEMLAYSIIIATGSIANRLHVPKEGEFWQRGISACAVCDGALPLFYEQELAVIGGGDTACEEASYLTKYGKKVYLIHRRDKLRASQTMQDRVFNNPKIEMIWNHSLVDVEGDNQLQKVILENTITKEQSSKEVRGLFYAIGHTPNTGFLSNQIELDSDKYIVTKNGSTQTSIEGVFAAGDVQDKVYRQAITSAGTGCMAALDAEHFLAKKKVIS